MKFKNDDLRDFIFEESADVFELVEESEWIADGKYECQEVIFKFEGKYYKYDNCRSGSYFSDWHYSINDEPDLIECDEVEKVEVIKHEWREVE